MPYDSAKPCVLFSPLGITDPIRNGKDGPFLHILRYYRPAAALLFMTEEIAALHKQDDRYRAAAKLVAPETALSIALHPEIENAQKFEIYDVLFSEALRKLHREYPAHQILVNISSGTPQMEASLYLQSAALPFEIIPVQVSTPIRKSNLRQDDFVLSCAWSTLAEAGDAAGNRCTPLKLENLQATILKRNIEELLKAYDYTAVLTLMNGAPELFGKSTLKLVSAAQARLSINKAKFEQLLQKAGENKKSYWEVDTADQQTARCYEYILMLDTLLARKSYGDYARAISPALTSLMVIVLKLHYGIDVQESLCVPNKDNDPTWLWMLDTSRIGQWDAALLADLDQSVSSHNRGTTRFRDRTPLGAKNILAIMQYYDKKTTVSDEACLQDFGYLREFEEKIRNLAAHQITAITAAMIEDKTKSSAEQAQAVLKRRFAALCPTELHWDGYEKLNERIRTLL